MNIFIIAGLFTATRLEELLTSPDFFRYESYKSIQFNYSVIVMLLQEDVKSFSKIFPGLFGCALRCPWPGSAQALFLPHNQNAIQANSWFGFGAGDKARAQQFEGEEDPVGVVAALLVQVA